MRAELDRKELIALTTEQHEQSGFEPPSEIWFPSDLYTLSWVTPSQIAKPILPHTPSRREFLSPAQLDKVHNWTIIVDKNVNRSGQTPGIDFAPAAIVVVGYHLLTQLVFDGVRDKIMAYVGNKARGLVSWES